MGPTSIVAPVPEIPRSPVHITEPVLRHTGLSVECRAGGRPVGVPLGGLPKERLSRSLAARSPSRSEEPSLDAFTFLHARILSAIRA